MRVGDHPTPITTRVLVGGVEIDDGYDLRWQVQDSTRPLFDYAHPHYRAIATGQALVSGSLSITWRYPGYLSVAIRNAIESLPDRLSSAADIAQGHNERLAEWAQRMLNATANQRIQLMADAMRVGPDFFRQISTLSAYIERGFQQPTEQEFVLPHEQQKEVTGTLLRTSPITIEAHHGDIEEPHLVNRLDGVVFVGASSQETAGALGGGGPSASGVPLFETYPFFARRVVQELRQPRQVTSPIT